MKAVDSVHSTVSPLDPFAYALAEIVGWPRAFRRLPM
jgi:hypothetical protein